MYGGLVEMPQHKCARARAHTHTHTHTHERTHTHTHLGQGDDIIPSDREEKAAQRVPKVPECTCVVRGLLKE